MNAQKVSSQNKTMDNSAQTIPFYKSITLQQIITIGTVAIALFNLYIGSRLAPVAQDVSTVTSMVKAQGERLDTLEGVSTLYLPRYIATEQQVLNLQRGIDRIEASQIRLEAKVDSINQK